MPLVRPRDPSPGPERSYVKDRRQLGWVGVRHVRDSPNQTYGSTTDSVVGSHMAFA